MTVEELLGRLNGVRETRSGWEALCPAHDDRKRSLTIAVGDSRALLLRCHAGDGCSIEQIVDALGITKADLFPTNEHSASRERGRIVAIYDYRDEGGAPLFQVVRYDPKRFAQRRPDGTGYVYRLGDVRRVLYRLPELLAADAVSTVYVVEGEKDADALAALRLVATTNPGGAEKWRAEYSDALRGRRVVIIPDADEPGRKHAAQVKAALEGVAADVRVVALPGGVKDISDYLAAGGTREALEALASTRAGAATGERGDTRRPPNRNPGVTVELISASDIVPQKVAWCWDGRIPLGMVTLLVGEAGLGKSTLLYDLTARLSTGSLAGHLWGTPSTVAIATAEDGLAEVVVPRLIAADAVRERVKIVTVRRDGVLGGMLLPDDLDAVRAALGEHRARCLIVDPLVAYLSGALDSHKDAHVRRALAPLTRFAEETGTAVVAVMHLNRSESTDVLRKICGSGGFGAAARSILLLASDPDDVDGPTRVLAHGKCNVGPKAGALRLRVEGRVVEGPEGSVETSRLAWLGEAPGVVTRDLLGEREANDDVRQAMDMMTELLGNGPVPAKEAQKALREAGVRERAMDAAKKRLGVLSDKKKGSFGGGWSWVLPSRRGTACPSSDSCLSSGKTPSDDDSNPAKSSEEGRRAEEGQGQRSRQPTFFDLTADERSRLEAEAAAGEPLARRLLGAKG